ncbi:EAL domain-containing protein [Dermatophilaceae bacterium Soc4.6]
MSSCIGCTCIRPDALRTEGSLLLATRVGHTLTALHAIVREHGAQANERTPGLLEITTEDVAGILLAAQRSLSGVEAAEVRAVQLDGQAGDELLALAMAAPTLQQLGARAHSADLIPLFADELNAFRAVYQPIVSLHDVDPAGSATVIGHEALLRATGPEGPIMPLELFGAAERAGWLHVLDRIGRTTALRGAKGWLGDDLLFVNFLPTTIYRPEVCLRTTEVAAERAGLRVEQLVFEVTESERITDLEHLADVFAHYKDRGCQVALDDLGAGYSSLNMLIRLQPDIVKLDKDIVQRLPDVVSVAVVSAVVDITHAYGGKVLAECVETQAQADCARELGVDLGQGWFFGRPVEREDPASPPVPRTAVLPAVVTDVGAFAGNDPAVALTFS